MIMQNRKHSKKGIKGIGRLSGGRFLLVEFNIVSQKLPIEVEFPNKKMDRLSHCIS